MISIIIIQHFNYLTLKKINEFLCLFYLFYIDIVNINKIIAYKLITRLKLQIFINFVSL